MVQDSSPIPLPQGAPQAPPPPDPSPVLQARLLQSTVEVIDHGEVFEFAIPTVRHEIRISSMIPRIRRLADPDSAGESMEGIDPAGYFYIRAIATFLTCLKSTSATWVHSPGPDGKPVVAWETWPAAVTNRVLEIALAFQQEVSRFHDGGSAEAGGAGGEALAGQPNPQ